LWRFVAFCGFPIVITIFAYMRKILLLLLLPTCLFAQRIEKDFKDEFTGAKIQKTSQEWLSYGGENASMWFFMRKVDDRIYLYFDLMPTFSSVYSISKDDQLMFKMVDGTIVTLNNLEYTISCAGCGGDGRTGARVQSTRTEYYLSPEKIDALLQQGIEKVRMYTSKGYVDQAVNPKRQGYIRQALIYLTQ
jgi:hypothetical protein